VNVKNVTIVAVTSRSLCLPPATTAPAVIRDAGVRLGASVVVTPIAVMTATARHVAISARVPTVCRLWCTMSRASLLQSDP